MALCLLLGCFISDVLFCLNLWIGWCWTPLCDEVWVPNAALGPAAFGCQLLLASLPKMRPGLGSHSFGQRAPRSIHLSLGCDYSHFTNEKPGAQRVSVTCLRLPRRHEKPGSQRKKRVPWHFCSVGDMCKVLILFKYV